MDFLWDHLLITGPQRALVPSSNVLNTLFIPEYNRSVKTRSTRAAFFIGVLPFDRKTSSPAYLQHKYFSISGHKMLWPVNRCGVFSKVTLSSALLLELASLEEDCLAAQCRTAVGSCQPRCGGHGRQSCSACAQHLGRGSVARKNPASHKSLCGVASIYNTTLTAGPGSPCVPAGTVRNSLCGMAPTLTAPTALCDAGIRTPACRCWLPAGSGGRARSPPQDAGGQGSRLLSASVRLWASPPRRPHVLCSFCAFWWQVLSPCATGPQTI